MQTQPNIFTIILPYPPSVNTLYRYGNGHMYMTQHGHNYKMLVKAKCNAMRAPKFNVAQRLELRLYAYPPDKRKRDLDNLNKLVFDSLQFADIYKDDSQIKILHAEMREPDGDGYIEVQLIAL